MQVDAVEQRARDARLVAGYGVVVAAAVATRRAAEAAGTGIGGGDELEVRWEDTAPSRASDGDAPVFQHLSQRLERTALELGQFVEEEYAPVRQRDLAGTRGLTAAQQPRRARCVVR